jgi:cobalamin biosynthesis protein CbiD
MSRLPSGMGLATGVCAAAPPAAASRAVKVKERASVVGMRMG